MVQRECWPGNCAGSFYALLFADLPPQRTVRGVWFRVGSPFSKAPSDSCPPEGRFTAAGLSLVGVTLSLFSPHQAAQAPEVTYEADKGSMWTLLLTNLGRCLGLARLRPPSPPLPGARTLGSWGRGQGQGQQGPAVSGVSLCADGHLLEPDAEYVHWLV